MFAETEDQELFERATVRFLETHFPMARVRALAAEPSTFEADRWRVKGDPDIRAPTLRFGDVDQDRLGRNRFSDLLGQCSGEPRLDLASYQGVEEEITQSGVELEGTRPDLNGPLVDLAVA